MDKLLTLFSIHFQQNTCQPSVNLNIKASFVLFHCKMQYPANYAALHFAIPPQSDRQPWNAEPEGLAPAPREKASAPLSSRT